MRKRLKFHGLEALLKFTCRSEASASRFDAIAVRLEAIACRLGVIASRLEVIAIRLEAIASVASIGVRPALLGWRPLLVGWNHLPLSSFWRRSPDASPETSKITFLPYKGSSPQGSEQLSA